MTKTTYNTFIELLLINRIFFGGINEDAIPIDEILSHLCEMDEKIQESSKTILSLLSENGITKYLEYDYQDSHCNTIEIIFENVIMIHYTNQYTNEITLYQLNNDDINNAKENKEWKDNKENKENKENTDDDDIDNDSIFTFTRLLFNQKDLVPQIFQYLELNDLNKCSLVNFVWLIHAFDINSLYYLNISQIFKWELKHTHSISDESRILIKPVTNSGDSNYNQSAKTTTDNKLSLRVWQRFINARKLVYLSDLLDDDDDENIKIDINNSKHVLTYFESLQNIEIVKFVSKYKLTSSDLSFLKILSLKSNKIQRLNASKSVSQSNNNSSLNSRRDININSLPVLKLPNAKKIRLTRLELPIITSNKCHSLVLAAIRINTWMYKALINDCDLTGIRKISLRDISIDGSIDDKQHICNSLAKKFGDFEKIEIRSVGYDTLLLWQALNTIMERKKNKINITINGENTCNVNVSVTFTIHKKSQQSELWSIYIDKVIPFIINNDIEITDAKFSIDNDSRKLSLNILKKNKICQYFQVLRVSGQAKHNFKGFVTSCFSKNVDVDIDNHDQVDGGIINRSRAEAVALMESINLSKLRCFSVRISLESAEDWKHIIEMLKCRFNYNYNCGSYNSNSKNDYSRNGDNNYSIMGNRDGNILWHLHLQMHISKMHSTALERMNRIFKRLWTNINVLFIQTGKPIDLYFKIYSYNEKYFNTMKKSYDGSSGDVYSTFYYISMNNNFRQNFLKAFGNLAHDKSDGENSMADVDADTADTVSADTGNSKWLDLFGQTYVVPKGNKYCKPLEKAEIWCKYYLGPRSTDGRKMCRISFCVKNAVYQRWKLDFD